MIAKSFYLVTQIKTDHETLATYSKVSYAVSSAVRGAVREPIFDLQQESRFFILPSGMQIKQVLFCTSCQLYRYPSQTFR